MADDKECGCDYSYTCAMHQQEIETQRKVEALRDCLDHIIKAVDIVGALMNMESALKEDLDAAKKFLTEI